MSTREITVEDLAGIGCRSAQRLLRKLEHVEVAHLLIVGRYPQRQIVEVLEARGMSEREARRIYSAARKLDA